MIPVLLNIFGDNDDISPIIQSVITSADDDTDGGSPFADDLLFPDHNEPITSVADELSLRVYPNPTSSELNLSLSGFYNDSPVQARLYSMSGELLWESEFFSQTSINLQTLGKKAGVYILSVQAGGWIRTEKVVYNPW